MKIELFMESLNQDYPGITDYRLIRSEDYRRIVKDWDLQWDKPWPRDANPCDNDAVAYIPKTPFDRFKDLFIRKEPFGGLLYNPSSGRVYKLDTDAFNLIEHLHLSSETEKLQGISIEQASHKLAGKTKLKAEDIAYLLHDLRMKSLW
jgi:hypothetical protein